MQDDVYSSSSSAWESSDQSDFQNGTTSNHNRSPLRPPDFPESSGSSSGVDGSPKRRTSLDLSSVASSSRWRDSPSVITETLETPSLATNDTATLVDGGFDESVLRSLCDMDVSPDSLSSQRLTQFTYAITDGCPAFDGSHKAEYGVL